jgi:hypothetical protein
MTRNRITKRLPRPVKLALLKIYRKIDSYYVPTLLRNMLGVIGYNVSRRKDFSSPLPTVSVLKRNKDRWNRPSPLKGVEYDLDSMKSYLDDLLGRYLEEFLDIPPYKDLYSHGFGWGYTAVDALTLYLMIRHIKPRNYVEVGSGLSTYYCSLAASKNREEGFPIKITCIEPFPFEKLYSIPDVEIISKEVQDVELVFFEQLEKNDVLFIDSSHILRVDGDVPYLYIEVLPTIKKGVYIHIHDIPLPYNFPFPPELWIFETPEPAFWNEAMVIQAFLAFNTDFEIFLSLPLIRYFDEDFLKEAIPIYETIEQNRNAFSSLWLKRVAS